MGIFGCLGYGDIAGEIASLLLDPKSRHFLGAGQSQVTEESIERKTSG